VLRLLDARTGSYAEVRPTRPGLLRVCAHPPESAAGLGISGLRVLLVSDLLARTAELRGLQVLTVLALSSQSPGQRAAAERAAGALGIHPPTGRAESPDCQSALGGPVDVHVAGHDASPDGAQIGLVVQVGAVHLGEVGDRAPESAADLLAGDERDPLSVRLALMSLPYQELADLTEGMLTRAAEAVSGWRQRVADWAESPSRPVPGRIAESVQAAFGSLDTVTVLSLLRGLALDADVPAGAKFEAFVYADRILGLDLARDIGRPVG
jgi:hypothetical protein